MGSSRSSTAPSPTEQADYEDSPMSKQCNGRALVELYDDHYLVVYLPTPSSSPCTLLTIRSSSHSVQAIFLVLLSRDSQCVYIDKYVSA